MQKLMPIQASMVLMHQYADRVRGELETVETKKGKGKSKRLHGNGMPQLLIEDGFFETVCEDDARQKEMEAQKETRKCGREGH